MYSLSRSITMAMCLANGLHWEGVRFPEFDPSILDGLITWYDFADHTFIEKSSGTLVTFGITSQDLYQIDNKWDSVSNLPNVFPIDINGNNSNGYFLGSRLRSEGSNTIPDWKNPSGLVGGGYNSRYVDFTGVYNLGGGTNNGSRRLKGDGTSSTESISLDNFTFYIVFKQDVASPTSPDGGKQNLVWVNGIKSSSDDESRLITLTKSGGGASGGGRYFLSLYVDGSLEANISAGSYTVDTSTKILGFIVNSSDTDTSIGRLYQSGDATYEDTSENGVATTMKGGEGAVSGDNMCYIGSKGEDVSANDPDNSFDGRMLEIVMYNRAIGTGEQSELETYFKTKWNI